MDISLSDYYTVVRKNFRLAALVMLMYLFFLFLVLNGYLPGLIVLGGIALGSYAAFSFPAVAVIAVLITGVIPTVFQMTPIFSEDYGVIGLGFHAPDIVLLSMAGAVLLQVRKRQEVQRNSLGLHTLILLFATWLLFEILRNFGSYGLSAPGEFRYRYLILILPLYITLFFPSAKGRLGLLKILLVSTLLIPLGCIPIIGQLKGWDFGFESRFFPSTISLGLAYGLISLFFARKWQLLRLSATALCTIAIPVVFMVLVDGHRSVWLAAMVSIVTVFLLREATLFRAVRLAIPLVTVAAVVVFAVSETGINITDYITTRGVAFTDFDLDPNARWRAAIWAASMDKILTSPFAGEGFGGYWSVWLPGLGQLVTVSPHSLYIQSLVKIGAIGLGLYLIIVFKFGRSLLKSLRQLERQQEKEGTLLATALVVLVASHAFYIAYAFEYYTWLFVGLGAAALRNVGSS